MTVMEIRISHSTIISYQFVDLDGRKQIKTQNEKHSKIMASK